MDYPTALQEAIEAWATRAGNERPNDPLLTAYLYAQLTQRGLVDSALEVYTVYLYFDTDTMLQMGDPVSVACFEWDGQSYGSHGPMNECLAQWVERTYGVDRDEHAFEWKEDVHPRLHDLDAEALAQYPEAVAYWNALEATVRAPYEHALPTPIHSGPAVRKARL